MCALNCILNARQGHIMSETWCRFQSFYVVFGISANSWLNAVIAREVHRMLRHSHQRKRYFPPKLRTITLQAFAVYAWTALCSILPTLNISWLPYKTALEAGAVCVPVEYNVASTVFFFCAFVPFLAVGPLFYVCWVAQDVMRKGLLPITGRTRELAIYFVRLIFVFVCMWLPKLCLFFIASSWLNPWVSTNNTVLCNSLVR